MNFEKRPCKVRNIIPRQPLFREKGQKKKKKDSKKKRKWERKGKRRV
jgi:hypothetical protein